MAFTGQTETFGGMIRTARLSANLTLRQLSEGLCSNATLSRIEAGERYPGYLLAVGLAERLGLSVKHFEMVIADDEYERLEKRRIIDALAARDAEGAEAKLKEYESLQGSDDALERQFVLHRRARAGLVRLRLESILMGSEMGGSEPDGHARRMLSDIRRSLGEALLLTTERAEHAGVPLLTVAERSIRVGMDCADLILGDTERERTRSFLKLREAFARFELMEKEDDALARPLSLAAIACASWYCGRGELKQALAICRKAYELLDGSGEARGKGFVCLAKARLLERLFPEDETAALRVYVLLKLAYHLLGIAGDYSAQKMTGTGS